MEVNESRRVRAIRGELERAVKDYNDARGALEDAQLAFDVALEKFSSVRRLASEIMSGRDWYLWQMQNKNVQYAAMPIGEAIVAVLRTRAYDMAFDHAKDQSPDPFSPSADLDEIVASLEAGGFDFRTTTRNREVNGALLKLEGVTKLPNGNYEISDASVILRVMVDIVADQKQAQETFGESEAEEVGVSRDGDEERYMQPDDDPPF